MKSIYLVLNLIIIVGSTLAISPQCLDDAGKPADWYIAYKFPYLVNETHNPLFTGYRYAVISSSASTGWNLSPNNINNETSSILAKTLAPVYGNQSSQVSSIFYNDSPPGGVEAAASFAHAKGIVVSDEQQGFWLFHSVPFFGQANGSYEYPESGTRYAQIFMCISLNLPNLEKVITQNILTTQPNIYSTRILNKSSSFGQLITKLETRQWVPMKTFTDTSFSSLGKVNFRSFYKSLDYHVDLFGGIVAPSENASLLVETWRQNPGNPLSSNCTSNPKTENVDQVKLVFENSKEVGQFSYLNEHSKWAVSSGTGNLVCVGDLSRMESQFSRAGGATCFALQTVTKAFAGLVDKAEKCH